MSGAAPFDPRTTYVMLRDSGATAVEVTESFWPDLMAGRLGIAGRMVCAFDNADFPHWERHPAGEELVVVRSGAMEFIFEEATGERTMMVCAGEAVLVPQGVWRRAVVREPGRSLFVTEGEGTEHKPIEG